MKSNHLALKMLARNGWTLVEGVRLLLALFFSLVLTWPAWREIAWSALSEDISRPAVLVLPVMFWLIWVRRSRFRFVKPGGGAIGWIVLLSGAQLFYVGHYVYELRSAWHFGAVLIVAGAVLLVAGKQALSQFLPAWLILPVLVPIPDTLLTLVSEPIQMMEAQFISMVYGVFGFSVQIIDSYPTSRLVIGGTTLLCESVCKGLPTILSLLLICYGFVFSSPMRPLVRVLLMVIAPFIALFCSAVALGSTLWLYDGDSALVTTDLIRAISQWATLLIAFLLIAGIVRLLVWASVPVHQYHLASTAP